MKGRDLYHLMSFEAERMFGVAREPWSELESRQKQLLNAVAKKLDRVQTSAMHQPFPRAFARAIGRSR